MKKSTKAILATGAVAITGAVGALTLQPEKEIEEIEVPQVEEKCLTPDCEIEKLELELKAKKARGEGLTITVQKINELKAQLK